MRNHGDPWPKREPSGANLRSQIISFILDKSLRCWQARECRHLAIRHVIQTELQRETRVGVNLGVFFLEVMDGSLREKRKLGFCLGNCRKESLHFKRFICHSCSEHSICRLQDALQMWFNALQTLSWQRGWHRKVLKLAMHFFKQLLMVITVVFIMVQVKDISLSNGSLASLLLIEMSRSLLGTALGTFFFSFFFCCHGEP